MSDIRLIALDLDGTLLNSSKELSKANADALAHAAARGIEIVPTTGRFFSGMPECIRALPYLHYIPEVMQLLPGVGEVSYNVRIGTVLVKYDAQKVSAARILEWIGAVVDEGVALAGEGAWQASDEERLRALALERLKRRLSRF